MPRVKLFDQKEVLIKAMEVFWNKGFYHTSMQDLVDGMGINRGSIYDTYGGKKELFDAAFEFHMNQNLHALEEFLKSKPDIRNGLMEFYELVIDAALSDELNKGCFIVNTTMELIPWDEKTTTSIAQYKSSFERQIEDYVQYGIDDGQISSDKSPKMIASLYYTFMTGIRVTGKSKPKRNTLLSSSEAIVGLLG